MKHQVASLKKSLIATLSDSDKIDLQLISIDDAITYVGWGDLVGAPKLRRWHDFAHPFDSRKRAFADGMRVSAIRIMERAIRAGRLRPVLVWPDDDDASALDEGSDFVLYAADLVNFANGVAITDEFQPFFWSLEFLVDGELSSFAQFQFLWDEVAQLADPVCEDIDLQTSAMGQVAAIRPAGPPGPPATERARGGRRPRQHGTPIASFLASVIADGIDAVATEKDEVLGRRLLREYEKAGQHGLPDLRNAAADARGAVTAWLEAQREAD